jgi:hypothetical protein
MPLKSTAFLNCFSHFKLFLMEHFAGARHNSMMGQDATYPVLF